MTDLKALRQQAGLTQVEAAELVHRSRDTWAAYESGKAVPDKAICSLFKILVKPIIKARAKARRKAGL